MGATRDPLSEEIIDRTRTSLAQVYTAAREADFLLRRYRRAPLVAMAHEHDNASGTAPAHRAESPTARAAVLELFSLPPERWHAALVASAPRLQRATLRGLVAATDHCARTAPHDAHRFADSILAIVGRGRVPSQAPVLRRQLAACALLARGRALVALHAYADALPAIAEAHRRFPRTRTYTRYRIDAEILRGRALAGIGRPAEALETLVIGARRAIAECKPPLIVDALTALAVVLCMYARIRTGPARARARCALRGATRQRIRAHRRARRLDRMRVPRLLREPRAVNPACFFACRATLRGAGELNHMAAVHREAQELIETVHRMRSTPAK